MRRLAGSPSLPQFNGGFLYFFLYFTDTPRVRRIFAQARHLAGTYDTLGYDRINRGIADEPLLAIALAAERLPAHDLTHTAMATPLGATGPITIDVLTGLATFKKCGRTVTPAAIHFAADYSSRRPLLGAHYRRERLKVTLAHRLGLRNITARATSVMLHGAPCWLLNQSLRRPSRRAAELEPPATEAP